MKIVPILILITFFSCKKTKTDYYNELNDCINLKYNAIKEEIGVINIEKLKSKDINIFDSIKKFENTLIKLKYLKNRKKSGYIQLVNKDINFQTRSKFLKKLKIEFPFYYEFGWPQNYRSIMYETCLLNIIVNQKTHDFFSAEKKGYERFFQEKYPRKKSLRDLIEITDFKNETARLLLCNLIYLNLYDSCEKF